MKIVKNENAPVKECAYISRAKLVAKSNSCSRKSSSEDEGKNEDFFTGQFEDNQDNNNKNDEK